MKTSVSSRKAVSLSDSVRQRLHPYTLAAGAAGVTMLALAPPGEAEIIYTPANQYIYGMGPPYALDLTGDGTTDFYLSAALTGGGSGYSGSLLARPWQAGNGVAAVTEGKFADDAAALAPGHRIGPKTEFGGSPSNPLRMAWGRDFSSTHSRGRCEGPWKNKQNRYLGLKFMISGEVHYGWAQLSVTSCFDHDSYIQEVLTGYAYESIPNKAIKAGQETGDSDESLNGPGKPARQSNPVPVAATLGMLAKGAPALSFWRQ
jgi:hypothetical protein